MGALCMGYLITGCSPVVIDSARIPSPDGTMQAIVERVDDGLGFGQGGLFNEVHVQLRGTWALVHGEPSHTVVFYAEVGENGDTGATVRWVDARHLLITYNSQRTALGRHLRRLGPVVIDYSPVT